ncbi:MAG: hypothetical protein DRI34_01780 [Deltaproteobacteria bacterium]|nr:MAG: hypothetical protein DRI34_01780 [Deltaproteobacteria bacterium]
MSSEVGFSLTILAGPDKGKKFDFDRVEITIGRTMENDVVLTDPGISRQHLSIRDKGGAYILKDLGSSNGTRLNGKPVKQEVLSSGDIIELGGARVRFEGAATRQRVPTARKKISRRSPGPPARRSASRQQAARARGRGRGAPGPAKKPAPAAGAGRGGQVVIRSPGMKAGGVAAAGGREAGAGAGRRPAAASGQGKLQQLITRGRLWFNGLERRKRILLLVVAGLVMLLLVALAFKGGKKIVRQVVDHSGETFEVGARDGDGELSSFGIGPVSIRCRESVNFGFTYGNGRATMKFYVAGIDNKDELSVMLNGVQIGKIPPPLSVGQWSGLLKWKLPRKHLLENEQNKLTFVNNINMANQETTEEWAVKVLTVVETALPEPDRKVAEENFKLAKKRYEGKSIAPENLYFALQHYKKVRDYLELIPAQERPGIYQEAVEMIDTIEKELQERYKLLMFTAEKDLKYGRIDRARQLYKAVMNSIPDQEDPRHQKARRHLEALE